MPIAPDDPRHRAKPLKPEPAPTGEIDLENVVVPNSPEPDPEPDEDNEQPTPEEALDAVLTGLTRLVNAFQQSDLWTRWNEWLAAMGMDTPMNEDIRRALTVGKNWDKGKVFSGPGAAAASIAYNNYWDVTTGTFRNDPVYGSGNWGKGEDAPERLRKLGGV